MQGFRLPAYVFPENALLNFKPINDAIDTWDRRQQQGIENERQNKLLQFQEQRAKMDRERFDEEKSQRVKERAGNLALLALQEPDEAKRAQRWGQFIQTHPEARTLDPKYHDPNTGPLAVLADAGMAGKYLDHRTRQAADRRADAQLGIAQAEASRAAELHKYKVDELKNPITTADIGPDHARVTLNKRTGEEISRIQGNPKGPDSTTRKAIYEAQDELPNLKSSVEVLNEARQLLPQIMTGYTANARAAFNQAMPSVLPNIISSPESARATQRYNQIMNAEAINAMSQTLKGATTDNEMRQFVSIMNDQNTAPSVKEKALERMLINAQRHYQNKAARIKELGGRMPDLGDQPATAPSSRPRAVNPQTGQAVEWNGSAWVPAQ